MPNWCLTTITFHGENAEKLNNLITEWTKESLPGVGFGERWLGNCLVNSGIMTFDEANRGPISCRGKIYDYELNEDELTVWTETAWDPMLQMWELINEKLDLGLEIIYEATNPDCEIYYTNNPAMLEKYYIDMYISETDSPNGECYELYDYEFSQNDLDKLLKELQRKFPEVKGLDDLDEYFEDDESYISVHKWKFVDIDDLAERIKLWK